MKKLILIALILFASVAFGQKYNLYIQNGEIKTTTSNGTVITCIKGSAVGWYNLNSSAKIVVQSPNLSNLITLDRALMLTYNGSSTIPINDTLMAHIKTISGNAGTPTTMSTTADSLKYKMNQQMGLNGHIIITGTTTTLVNTTWCLNAMEATVIAGLSYRDNADTISALTLAAGQTIYGKFDWVKLTSGKVILYK